MNRNPRQLARDREDAAARLQHAIEALGDAWRTYREKTAELDEVVGRDLHRRLDLPVILAMTGAGLTPFLERKHTGQRPSLELLAREQHEQLGLGTEA